MIAKKLFLENFRNYKSQTIDFSDKMNILYGKNGQGKTNVIEALYYFCTCKSFRSIHDSEVVKLGEKFSHIKLNMTSQSRENNAEIFISDKKSVKINDIVIEKQSELIGLANMVVFTPNQLNLIREGPGIRRNFADILISQIKPLYFKNLINYYKILKQRNIILKSKNKSMTDTLDVWDEKLAEYGVIICKLRNEILNNLDEILTLHLSSNNEKINIKYLPSIKDDFCDKENFIRQIKKSKDKDLEKGMTFVGPHRDDFDVFYNNFNLKKYGSQGQTRAAVLKMKIAECEMINKAVGEQPLLLLDDVLSELDEEKRNYFTNNIKNKQVIITCTEKNFFINKDCEFFCVNDGKVRRD